MATLKLLQANRVFSVYPFVSVNNFLPVSLLILLFGFLRLKSRIAGFVVPWLLSNIQNGFLAETDFFSPIVLFSIFAITILTVAILTFIGSSQPIKHISPHFDYSLSLSKQNYSKLIDMFEEMRDCLRAGKLEKSMYYTVGLYSLATSLYFLMMGSLLFFVRSLLTGLFSIFLILFLIMLLAIYIWAVVKRIKSNPQKEVSKLRNSNK